MKAQLIPEQLVIDCAYSMKSDKNKVLVEYNEERAS